MAGLSILLALSLVLLALTFRARPPMPDLPDDFDPGHIALTVEVTRGGVAQHATFECEGATTGTGYLEAPWANGSACITAATSLPAVEFLLARDKERTRPVAPRGQCPEYISAWQSIGEPTAPPARATITGLYEGLPIERTINTATGGRCDVALWHILRPLFEPSTDPVYIATFGSEPGR